MVGMKLLYRDT